MKMFDRLKIDGKDLRIIKNLYWNQKVAVKIDDDESKWQCIERGDRQGCVMSPDLFNLYSEMIMREIKELEGIRLNGYNINNIRYADDKALVADSEGRLQCLLNVLNEVSERKGLKINKSKTEVMVISRAVINPRVNIRIKDNLVKQVGRFNYLGSLINDDGRCEDEIRKRINKAKCAFNKMKNMLTISKVSIETRI